MTAAPASAASAASAASMAPATPRVLMLHGAGGGGWEWAAWARVFAAEGWTVAAPDVPAADADPAGMALADERALALAAAHALGPGALLVGASLGGLHAMAIADAAGASGLVLVNPIPPAGVPGADWPPAPRTWPARVPWGRDARLAGTRRALPGADEAAALHAFRRWRDASGRALAEAAAGLPVARPACPVLVLASRADADVPAAASAALALAWGADLQWLDGGHVDPLLGRDAPRVAALAAAWADARRG